MQAAGRFVGAGSTIAHKWTIGAASLRADVLKDEWARMPTSSEANVKAMLVLHEEC